MQKRNMGKPGGWIPDRGNHLDLRRGVLPGGILRDRSADDRIGHGAEGVKMTVEIHLECRDCGTDQMDNLNTDEPIDAISSFAEDGWEFSGAECLCPGCAANKAD